MANEKDEKSTPRLGNIDKRISLSKLGTADNPKDSGPLIGGEDSSAIGSFVGNVASGLGSVISAPFEAADRALAAAAGVEYRDEVASPIGKLGQGIQSVQESIATGDPERQEDIASKLGQGLGSVAGFALPFAAAGNLGRIGTAAMSAGLGAASTGVEQASDYEAARAAAGLKPEKSDQAAALFYGMIPGVLEAVPVARMFGRLDNLAEGGLKAAIKNTAKGTAEEAIQEGLQSVASNFIANDVVRYDPDRDMFFDSGEAAALGGGVGFIMNSLFSAVGLRARGGKYQNAAEVAEVTSAPNKADPKINPVTGADFGNQDIAKTHELIRRWEDAAAVGDQNQAAYTARVKELKDGLRERYLAEGANPADKQEATDVLTGLREEATKQKALSKEESDSVEKQLTDLQTPQEAAPFPKKEGVTVRDITSKKSIEQYNAALASIQQPEEITIAGGVAEPFPTTEGISVTEEQDPNIEEITLDSTPADPASEIFLSDKPANTAMADALIRVAKQRKTRDETDAAFQARKDQEIQEAWRQRELQLADEAQAEPTQDQEIQPTTIGTPDALSTEQAQETIQRVKDETGVDIKETMDRLSEIVAPQAGGLPEDMEAARASVESGESNLEEIFAPQAGDTPENLARLDREDAERQGPPQDPQGTPAFLTNRDNIPPKNGLPDGPVEETLEAKREEEVAAPVAPDPELAVRKEKKATNAIAEGIEVTKSGAPFKSERVAKAARTRKGLGATHDIVPYEGGYALKANDAPLPTAPAPVPVPAESFQVAGKPKRIPTLKTSQPESIPMEPAVYDEIVRLTEELKAAGNSAVDYAAEIADTFGSVKQFMALSMAVENGSIVRAVEGQPEVMPTPVGVVETEEAITQEHEEVKPTKEQSTSELLSVEERLDALDIRIGDLQAELDSGYAKNPSDLTKQIARLTREQRELEASQTNLKGKVQSIEKDEIAELSKIENSVEVIDDVDAEFLPDGTNAKAAPSSVEIAMTKRLVDRIWSRVAPLFKKKLEIYVVTKVTDIPARYPNLRKEWTEKHENGTALGLHINPNNETNNKSIVLIHPRRGKTEADVQWTLFHEIVGHFGFKQMFPDSWSKFMEKALKNPELASKAFSLRKRWTDIKLTPEGNEPTMTVNVKYEYIGASERFPGNERFRPHDNPGTIVVSKAKMVKLMDEYVAELAGTLSNKTFRDATTQERSFIQRVLAWLRHFFRSGGFGKIASEISEAELMSFVGESETRVLNTGRAVDQWEALVGAEETRKEVGTENPGELLIKSKDAAVARMDQKDLDKERRSVFEIDNPFDQSPVVDANAYIVEIQQAVDEAANQAVEARIIKTREEASSILSAIRGRVGRIDNSSRERRGERIADRLRRSRAGRVLSSVGHLNEPRVLNAIESITKGGIEKGQMMARKFANKTKNLNDIQKRAIYEYFKTKDARVNDLPVDDALKALTRDTKQYIEDLGESLVHLGLLRRETWEADRGSYLSIRYWKYIQKYYSAGGKRLSLKNYLKQQKGLTDAEKQALGEIKDPSFIVPETVVTISRDVALHSMFRNIITMDQVGGLGWVLGDRQFTDVGGKRMKLSDIDSNIETLEQLKDTEQGINPLWKDTAGDEEIDRQLQELYEAKERAEESMRQEIRGVLRGRGIEEPTDAMVNSTIKAEFIQVKDKRYGPLYNKYIRKELHEEIVDSNEAYNKEHTDFMGRWFGIGGHGEKAHQIWKASKVVLNPPSWVRNAVGNMVLLDIGTNTNSVKLMKMVASELNSWIKGSPSKYFHYSHEQGLWNTTFSASELNLMSDQFQDKFKNEINLDNETQMFKKMWWFTHGKFFNAMEKATNIYGGMEGFFKTVAMRDHIETWEAQNGPIENADSVTRESVIREAAETANKNIFDYSKVPGWMRTMRRMPFVGAPFLTYTFKAIPATFDAAISRPQKMIKYMAFPYMMAQWFMMENDMDDEDFEELRRKLPQWQKEQSSVFLLPYKDGNGKWQTMDFGYYLPWAAMHNMYLQVSNTLDVNNPVMSTLEASGKSMMDLGFLGGPMPNMISALITNKDPFMGKEIIRTTGTTADKTNDFLTYLVDLWTPTFLTSKGVMGRALDNMGLEPTPFNTGKQFTAFGSDKETGFQAGLRGVGVNMRGFDPQEAVASKVKAYTFEKRKLETARRGIFKDRNLSREAKISKAREINEQIKLLNKKHREELHGKGN